MKAVVLAVIRIVGVLACAVMIQRSLSAIVPGIFAGDDSFFWYMNVELYVLLILLLAVPVVAWRASRGHELSGALFAEFLGTAAIIFFSAGAVIANHASGGALGNVGIAMAYGLATAAMFYTLGHASGGHFNPAVTAAMIAIGETPVVRGALYVITQVVGAIAGLIFLSMSASSDSLLATSLGACHYGHGIGLERGVILDGIITFFLVLVFIGTTLDRRAPKGLAGAAIGMAIMMGSLFGAPFTGAAMNPARALAPALFTRDAMLIANSWVGPIFGAVLAGCLYKFVYLGKTATPKAE